MSMGVDDEDTRARGESIMMEILAEVNLTAPRNLQPVLGPPPGTWVHDERMPAQDPRTPPETEVLQPLPLADRAQTEESCTSIDPIEFRNMKNTLQETVARVAVLERENAHLRMDMAGVSSNMTTLEKAIVFLKDTLKTIYKAIFEFQHAAATGEAAQNLLHEMNWENYNHKRYAWQQAAAAKQEPGQVPSPSPRTAAAASSSSPAPASSACERG
jgi:hypothetical protein